jgi:carbon monoxide dehydrogenase subunit G
MARYVTKVRTTRSATDVFAFMADLRNLTEWDPGVKHAAMVEGEAGTESAVVDVTVSGTTLRYRTTSFDPPTSVVVRAESATMVSIDRIDVLDEGSTRVVTYDADLRLKGVARVAEPVLWLAFRRIGDRAAAGLRRVLDGEKVAV